ncbi:MAG: TIGR03032 family protein [Bacteroidota bacterium]|nr:TIGR03032 family protein [Bacteroidota bacterium]
MNILITFCNTIDTPTYPNLGVLDIITKEFKIVNLPPEILQTGMLGLAMSSKYLFVGLQHSASGKVGVIGPPAVLVFDLRTFNLVSQYPLALVKDIHSFLLSPDERTLYVVSSGTDEIIRLTLHGAEIIHEEIFWSLALEKTGTDTFHINSISLYKSDILVSGFGLKEIANDWNTANNGFIYNVTKGKEIASGLKQPHSICGIGFSIAFCESRNKVLRFVDDDRTVILPGYTRGLCFYKDKIYVGTSASRKKSKSTGKPTIGTAISPGGCTISEIDMDSLDVLYTWDLNDYAVEIYEFMLVPDVSNWPLISPRNYREEFQQSWIYKTRSAIEDLKEIIPEGSKFLFVDDNLLQISETMLAGRTYFSFTEKDGMYWGPPVDDTTSITELERMRSNGTQYIVFAWPSYWWLDHYVEFHQYLSEHYFKVFESDNILIFDLQKE